MHDSKNTKPGSGAGAGSFSGTGTGTGTALGRATGTVTVSALFDHEKLEVDRVAREFLVLGTSLLERKLPREFRDQFDRASVSILSNIGEGAGKTAKADKQRSYEIARGSTTEAAMQLDVLRTRGLCTVEEYEKARSLLIRETQMLSGLCDSPV